MREVRVYSTLAGQLVPIQPRAPPRLSMFVCGITPYKPSHIGHARTMVFFDVVARFLEHVGYHVFYLQNLTDIDDRIIRISTEEGVDTRVVAERNFAAYLLETEALGIRSVNLFARCTDFIPEIIGQIQTLIQKGHAYVVEGDVYYSVASFPDYGKLSGQRMEEQQVGVRIEVNPRKRAPEDFALWKSEKDGPLWDSPWGRGRPGWHIEDTAITVSVLGASYDLHGGAMELKFPHHEAEIAQAEAATGVKPLARIWMHAGLLNMQGQKMSKSLGNVLSIAEALRIARPDALRFYLLSAHYRGPLDFSGAPSFEEAERSYASLEGSYLRLRELAGRLYQTQAGVAEAVIPDSSGWREWLADLERKRTPDPNGTRAVQVVEAMEASLCDDFKIREATAALFSWSSEVNSILASRAETLTSEEVVALMAPYRFAEKVLGYFEHIGGGATERALARLVAVALDARARARERKDYAEADRIRAELLEAGVVVEDSGGKVRWSLKP